MNFTVKDLERFLSLAPVAKITFETEPHPKFPNGHVITWVEDANENDGYRWSRFASLQEMMELASVHPSLTKFFEALDRK